MTPPLQGVPGELTWIYLARLVTWTDRKNFLLSQTIFASCLSIFMFFICMDDAPDATLQTCRRQEADGGAVWHRDVEG